MSVAKSFALGKKHEKDPAKFDSAAFAFHQFCEFPILYENQETIACLTALTCFTEFLEPPKGLTISDTAFTGLYKRDALFRKNWLQALRSIVSYVVPLNGQLLIRLADGSMNPRDVAWLRQYDWKAILSKLEAAEAKETGNAPSVKHPPQHKKHRRFRPRSELENAHVLHSMRAMLEA
jgi:hypothetical protein